MADAILVFGGFGDSKAKNTIPISHAYLSTLSDVKVDSVPMEDTDIATIVFTFVIFMIVDPELGLELRLLQKVAPTHIVHLFVSHTWQQIVWT